MSSIDERIKSFVESSQTKEDAAPYGSASAPKRRSALLAGTVREAVEKIPVLRNERGRRRRIIIRPDDSVKLRVLFEIGDYALESIGMCANVRVEKQNHFPLGMGRSQVSSPGGTGTLICTYHPRSEFARDSD